MSQMIYKNKYFFYDKNFQLISKDYYDFSGELVNKSNYENLLNEKAELVKQTEFRAIESSLTDSTEIKYRVAPYETFGYLYDENGHLIQLNYIQSVLGPSFKGVTECKKGITDKQATMDLNDKLILSTQFKCLEFDHENNCTKFMTLKNNQP